MKRYEIRYSNWLTNNGAYVGTAKIEIEDNESIYTYTVDDLENDLIVRSASRLN